MSSLSAQITQIWLYNKSLLSSYFPLSSSSPLWVFVDGKSKIYQRPKPFLPSENFHSSRPRWLRICFSKRKLALLFQSKTLKILWLVNKTEVKFYLRKLPFFIIYSTWLYFKLHISTLLKSASSSSILQKRLLVANKKKTF